MNDSTLRQIAAVKATEVFGSDSRDVWQMVAQEGIPALTGRAAAYLGHVLGDGRLSDREAKLLSISRTVATFARSANDCTSGILRTGNVIVSANKRQTCAFQV